MLDWVGGEIANGGSPSNSNLSRSLQNQSVLSIIRSDSTDCLYLYGFFTA
jgi:hypothetical protein